jgi:hypothetical protein
VDEYVDLEQRFPSSKRPVHLLLLSLFLFEIEDLQRGGGVWLEPDEDTVLVE